MEDHEIQPIPDRPTLSPARPIRNTLLLDPIAWAVLAGVFLYLKIDPTWLLVVVPLWVALRVWRFCRRCKRDGLW
jgi:hypothetical protein